MYKKSHNGVGSTSQRFDKHFFIDCTATVVSIHTDTHAHDQYYSVRTYASCVNWRSEQGAFVFPEITVDVFIRNACLFLALFIINFQLSLKKLKTKNFKCFYGIVCSHVSVHVLVVTLSHALRNGLGASPS